MVKLADVIVPDVFTRYVIQKTAVLFAMYMSGIVAAGPQMDALATHPGGKLINIPFWNDLDGDDEVLSDSAPLTAGKITAGQDVAVLLARGRAWGAYDLAADLAGDDPVRVIVNRVADYKFRRLQTSLINTLTGVFADNVANDSSDMVTDASEALVANITEATCISPQNVIRAVTGSMGDSWDKITGMIVHSNVFADMQTQNQVVYYDTDGNVVDFNQGYAASDAKILIPMYLGKYVVVVDDGVPVTLGATPGTDSDIYTSYLFGPGAIAYGEGNIKAATEMDRDILAGTEFFVHKWHTILHPRGVAFQTASVTGATPTNAELATAANWSRVYERKNVRLASIVTNVLSNA